MAIFRKPTITHNYRLNNRIALWQFSESRLSLHNDRIALWLFSESRLSLHNDILGPTLEGEKRIRNRFSPSVIFPSGTRLSLHSDILGPSTTKNSKSYLDFSPMILYQIHYQNHNFLVFLRVAPLVGPLPLYFNTHFGFV